MESSIILPTRRLGPVAKEEENERGGNTAGFLSGGTSAPLGGDGRYYVLPVADRSTRRRRQCWRSFCKNMALVRVWCRPRRFRSPNLFRLDVSGVQMAFLCYLEPGSFSNPHYLVRRLRRKLPKATIVAGFWTLKTGEIEERNALTATGADLVAVSLQQAVEQVIDAVKAAANGPLNAETRPPIRCRQHRDANFQAA